ncbi:hypothetical protein BCR36DRAFT_253368, partial [Piromyces finnis]
ISDTVLTNSYAECGYLLYIESHKYEEQHIKLNNFTFSNSTPFIRGDSIKINIENSAFKNVTKRVFVPLLSNSKNSLINISNTEISNLELSCELFNDESQYYLNDIKINNIKSNGKALFHFVNNNITINNCEFENINCNGDINYSSLIIFDSNESNKKISISNSVIKNSYSNGPLIKITGSKSDVILDKFEITKVTSYGPFIENTSEKV